MQHKQKFFKMPKWPNPSTAKDRNSSLARMKVFLDKLGNPHLKLPPVIHVGGTNGKGSTLAYLQAIFAAAGYRVHKYISPHLVEFNERITLSNSFITDNVLEQLADECYYYSEKYSLEVSFFEGVTLMAFLAFSRVEADILLLEVGMGGRLDATNVIHNPLATVVTSISFDHMEFLGNSLEQIATEKAGILKPHSIAIFSWQVSQVMEVLLARAKTVGCTTYACGYNWNFEKNHDNTFQLQVDNNSLNFPQPGLVGLHQYLNASTAALTSLKMVEYFPKITQGIIGEGIQKASWPGRMERLTKGIWTKLLPENFELWFDGAHNDGGIQMVMASLEFMQPEAVIYIIHGRTIYRDMAVFLKHFLGRVELIACIEIMGEPDAENPYKIKAVCDQMGIQSVVADSLKEAIEELVQYHTNKYPGRVARTLICGSLFLAGDVKLLTMSEKTNYF
jgi:dihydrofolate synthase/folylpolyglutamate synthase